MNTRLILWSILPALFMSLVNAAPPVVTLNSPPVQRPGTKFVDINYTLALDPGLTAFVELWFSPDNGLNFPIRCVDVSGDVGANTTSGPKTATWNAESDWDQQFTSSGKIRVIATYGSQSSGFAGSGTTSTSTGSGQASGNLKLVYMDVLWMWNIGLSTWEDASFYFKLDEVSPSIKMDQTEVTQAEWDEVAQWALTNGYSGLPLSPSTGSVNLPRTGVNLWEVLKWCNARSEKSGRTPAYYTDADEITIGDVNNNGIIESGPDFFWPFDPAHDTNQNGVWDVGESFTDNNNNGLLEPNEYQDLNNNGVYDQGHSTPYRQGAKFALEQNLHHHIDGNASGFRLPPSSVFQKVATGGSNKTMWPWGNSSPANYSKFTTDFSFPSVQTNGNNSSTPLANPSEATRPANGYDIKDILGNVAEYTEGAWNSSPPGSSSLDIRSNVFGGSYIGLRHVHPAPSPTTFNDNVNPVDNMMDLLNDGSADASSPAVGFRTWRNN